MYQNFQLNWIQHVMVVAILLVFCDFSSVVKCHETDMSKELLLTYNEKVAFDKFKSQVHPNTSHAHGFIKTDLFLLRWLRAKDLDVQRAVKDMFEYLEWRGKNNIDNIQLEDWSDMIADHPYRMDVIDLQGRPVAVFSVGGRWNIRRSAIEGRLPRLSRFAYKLMEELFQELYEINHKHPNVTQFSVIISLEGFNLLQQGCPLCLSTYIQILSTYNRFYPNFAHALIVINTPQTFNVVLNLMRPMLNKPTREALKIYSYNKNQWKPILDNEISEDQLTREFGGTRPDDDD